MRTSQSRSGFQHIRAGLAPFAKSVFLYTGTYAAFRAVLPSRSLAILRYHAICGPEGYGYADPQICIAPENFERHVAYLSNAYSIVRLDEAAARLAAGEALPRNAVAITFDDGYADNLVAARILAKHGATATFYITAGCLAGGQPFWPAEIRHLVSDVRASRIRIEASGVALDLPVESERDRSAAVKALTKAFKSNLIPVREELRGQLRRLASNPTLPRIKLTWDALEFVEYDVRYRPDYATEPVRINCSLTETGAFSTALIPGILNGGTRTAYVPAQDGFYQIAIGMRSL